MHWDNGDTNIYMQCDETSTYNLRKVDEPRILVDEMIAVGCRVVRGTNKAHLLYKKTEKILYLADNFFTTLCYAIKPLSLVK